MKKNTKLYMQYDLNYIKINPCVEIKKEAGNALKQTLFISGWWDCGWICFPVYI